jgi:hypothetical protein
VLDSGFSRSPLMARKTCVIYSKLSFGKICLTSLMRVSMSAS